MILIENVHLTLSLCLFIEQIISFYSMFQVVDNFGDIVFDFWILFPL